MAKPFVRIGTIKQSNPIVDSDGRPTSWFTTALNTAFGNLAEAINTLAALPEIQQALADAQAAVIAANAAAANAQAAADATKREAALTGSYIEPDSVLTADSTTITIAAHIRYYADGTSAAVSSGSITATDVGDVDYISYEDLERDGGMVTYVVSTTPPVQTGDTHVVGAVEIPTTGTVDGGEGPARPGKVTPREITP